MEFRLRRALAFGNTHGPSFYVCFPSFRRLGLYRQRMNSLHYILASNNGSDSGSDFEGTGRTGPPSPQPLPTNTEIQPSSSANPRASVQNVPSPTTSVLPKHAKIQSSTPTNKEAAQAKSTMKKRSKRAKTDEPHSRQGSTNYTANDVDLLLEIVAELEPTGANGWARVAQKFNDDITDADKAFRTAESLKDKFDRLIHVHKPTGDPMCPPFVRRAKQINRDIQAKVVAAVLGKHDDHINPSPEELQKGRDVGGVVGERRTKRNIAPTELPVAKRFQQDIVKHMELTSEGVSQMAKWVTEMKMPSHSV
ncbi:hypothetical protein FGB62_230g05 [Gracilaria domingensis]|nr:hypothetical protein FGB62_230g05 [Gracilaria domingensis]